MAKNDRYLKIRNQLFLGDLGKEAKIQNDAILAIMLRQDALIATLTDTKKQMFDSILEPYNEFLEISRNNALNSYNEKQKILGKESILKEDL